VRLKPEDKVARDELVRRFYEVEAQLFPSEEAPAPSENEEPLLFERMFQTLAEYSDRLPRERLSVCPYCGEPLKRVFDPWGMDGMWWHSTVKVAFEEPAACEHFRVLLGALNLAGRAPAEVRAQVLPGPDVPFVVPKLLDLPGMVAVVGSLRLPSGDLAYPIGYFSDQPTRSNQLHQSWCRESFWYTDTNDKPMWFIANDEFDFELRPWLERGKLRWVDLEEEGSKTLGSADGKCPFLDLPGERERQQIVVGERDLIGLPSGDPVNPFEE
jgi:hypothetical protein